MTLRNDPTVTTASANLARDRLNDTSWKVLEFTLARDLVDGVSSKTSTLPVAGPPPSVAAYSVRKPWPMPSI